MEGCPVTALITSATTLPGLIALGIVLVGMPFYIKRLKQLALGQAIREDGPQSHLAKAGTPTAGGLLLMLAWTLSLLALIPLWGWSAFANEWPWLLGLLAVGWSLGGLGFWDDALKILKKHNKGITGYTKLGVQVGASLLMAALPLLLSAPVTQDVWGLTQWAPGIWWWPLAIFAVTGASNAVNLTDGLDGLAGSTLTISFATLALWLWKGWILAPSPLFLPVSIALALVCFGFLNYNWNPAKVFMGDSGSLAFGGLLAALLLWCGQGLWLAFLGLIFIVETVSVILQVLWFKRTGKRLFRMAPLHHHFELGGWNETRVVRVFAGVQLLACLIASFIVARG